MSRRFARRKHSWIAIAGGALVVAPTAFAQGVASGTYIGNEVDSRNISGVGFQPSAVLIKKYSNSPSAQPAIWRTTTISGTSSKTLTGGGWVTDRIQAIKTDGFQVGTNLEVNESGKIYVWVAIKASAGEVTAASYLGNGSDNRNIHIGTAYWPAFALVVEANGSVAQSKFSSQGNTTDLGLQMDTQDGANDVQRFYSAGFQVGGSTNINTSGDAYHYLTLKTVSSEVHVASYTGNGAARNISIPTAFTPEFVWLQCSNCTGPKTMLRAQAYAGNCQLNASGTCSQTEISDLTTGGFQVSTANETNQATKAFHYMAVARQTPSAVGLTEFAATPWEGGTLLEWQTGFEADNVGFHVYRRDGASRRRVNDSIVTGSMMTGVLAATRPRTTPGRTYVAFDPTPPGPSTQYVLEDIDVQGKKTEHAPARARRAPLFEMPDAARSVRARAHARTETRGPSGRLLPELALGGREGVLHQMRDAAPGLLALVSPGAPLAKVLVEAAGVVSVTRDALVSAGVLDASASLERVSVITDGRPIPVEVVGGGIQFYATGRASRWGNSRAYFVTQSENPIRLGAAPAGNGATAPNFEERLEWKQKANYYSALLNGPADNFVGPIVDHNPLPHTFHLPGLAANADGELTVSVYGLVHNEKHALSVTLNGETLGLLEVESREHASKTFAVPANLLTSTAELTLRVPDETVVNVALGAVTLSYPRAFVAQEDVLAFRIQSGSGFEVAGFSDSDLEAWDVTNADAPTKLALAVEKQRDALGFVAKGSAAPGDGERDIIVFRKVPASLAPEVTPVAWPSWLSDGARAAEFVIIAPGQLSWQKPVAALVAKRKTEGLRTVSVDVESLYNFWGNGTKDPLAIKRFLQEQSEAHGTRYVLVAGDASFDPQGVLAQNGVDVIPTGFVDTHVNETASDDWLVDFDDDSIPELAIGRLPAETAGELAVMVNKAVAHAPVKNPALILSGKNSGNDFTGFAQQLGAHVPMGTPVELHSAATDPEGAKQALHTRLQAGASMIGYLGHSSVEVLENEGKLLSASEAALLENPTPPLFVLATCFTGMFQTVFEDKSLAEALLVAPGGASSVWASTGYTFAKSQLPMVNRFVELTATKPVGEAARLSKSTATDADVRRSWVLLGDPTMRMYEGVSLLAPESPDGAEPEPPITSTPEDSADPMLNRSGCACTVPGSTPALWEGGAFIAGAWGLLAFGRRRRRG